MRIVLVGDVGVRHVGDDAMFEVALAQLRTRWPDAKIAALSGHPGATARQYGLPTDPLPCHDRRDEPGAIFAFQRALDVAADGPAGAWLPEIDDLHDAAAAIRQADALVIAGGGNINSQWPHLAYGRAAVLGIARAYGVPAVLTSQTIGPHLTTLQRAILCDLLQGVELIGVREPSTATVLRGLGIGDDRLSHQPDDAVALSPRRVARWPFGRREMVILATLADGAEADSQFESQQAVLERLVAFAERRRGVVALCPHTRFDVDRHAKLVATLPRRSPVHRLPLRGAAETRWMVGKATLVVTTRYHALVFALGAAVPGIGLHDGEYTRVRMAGALGHAALEGCDLELEHAADHLDQVLARVIGALPALSDTLKRARAIAIRSLDAHWEALCASIEATASTGPARRARPALPSPRVAVPVPPLAVVIDPLRFDGAEAIAVARLEGDGLPPTEVSFRFPAKEADPAVLGDAYLLAFLLPAMQLGRDLHVRFTASSSLVEQLDDYQRVWHCWRPATYRCIRLTADALTERSPVGTRRTLFAFSSGLDSSYTAWKLSQEGRHAVGAMVLGYNIPVTDQESWAALRQAGGRTLASRGMELIPVSTDWRQSFAKVSWDDAHGIMVAAILTLLSGRFSDGLIAATHDPRRFNLPKGSESSIDPLLGSARFPIRHHGGDVPRLAKLAAVASWPEAFDNLQVCWLYGLATNCGRCIRCSTLAAACTAMGLPLPRNLPDEPLERDAFSGSHVVADRAAFVEDTMRAASLTGVRHPRVDELSRVLDVWRMLSDRVEGQRLGDVVSGRQRTPAGRWSRLANRVDQALGSPGWRAHLRPAVRALRSLKL